MRVLPGDTLHVYLYPAPSGLVGTIGVKLTDPLGVPVIARTTAGITEVLTGIYHKQLTAPSSNGSYLLVWDNGATLITSDVTVGATEDSIANSLFDSQVTVISAVNPNADVTIIRGDDYLARDGRDLQWADSAWPDLTGATVRFTSRSGDEDLGTSKLASILTPSGAGKRISLELTAAETATHISDHYDIDLRAELPNGDDITLVRARMTVVKDIHP